MISPTRAHPNLDGISIGSARASVQQTDRPCYINSNTPHLMLCIRHGTGSLGHRVSRSSFTSGSPGHHFDPVWPEIFRFSKKGQNKDIKIYIFVKIRPTVIEILTFNKWSSKFYFPEACKRQTATKLANLLPIANVCLQHKSIFGVCYTTGSLGQLGLRVAGFPGHWVAGSQNVTQFHVCFA